MCFFNETLCVPQDYLWAIGIVGVIFILLVVISAFVLNKKQKEASVINSQPSGRVEEEILDEDDAENTDDAPVKIGQKILYDTSAGYECNLIVTEVNDDKSKVMGYFTINMPQDVEILVLHLDGDGSQISFSFKTPDGGAKELIFNTEKPNELKGYEVFFDHLTTITKSAKPS